MEIGSDGMIPFLDVPVIRKERTLATREYRKPLTLVDIST
jgi:hypothetical protein